ncbi:MAG: hypothetical protein VB144_02455 [Clostridia bacterium]|nr:hypothetical protein [Clostridia bacterium]
MSSLLWSVRGWHGMTILLLAEGDSRVREVLRALLLAVWDALDRLTIIECAPEEAVSLVRVFRPSRVLLEATMFGALALPELVRECQNVGARLVIMSSEPLGASAESFVECGAVRFLRKPFDGAELLLALKAADEAAAD